MRDCKRCSVSNSSMDLTETQLWQCGVFNYLPLLACRTPICPVGKAVAPSRIEGSVDATGPGRNLFG